MTEFEILELNSLSYINNGMYMVALAILIFIALRAARVTNESGGNMAAKILTSIFGVFVAFFSLQLAGWRVLFDTNTAARLAELQERCSCSSKRSISRPAHSEPTHWPTACRSSKLCT